MHRALERCSLRSGARSAGARRHVGSSLARPRQPPRLAVPGTSLHTSGGWYSDGAWRRVPASSPATWWPAPTAASPTTAPVGWREGVDFHMPPALEETPLAERPPPLRLDSTKKKRAKKMKKHKLRKRRKRDRAQRK